MTELNIIDGQTTNDPALMATTTAAVHIRAPKRVIHFSDGTLEEYSDDDDRIDHSEKMNNDNNSNQQIDVNRWGPWMTHRIVNTGNRVLTACDYVGEKLTDLLGITTPKYDYEIKQFKRLEEERKRQQEEENVVGGWMQATHSKLAENEQQQQQRPTTTAMVTDDKCITRQDQVQRY